VIKSSYFEYLAKESGGADICLDFQLINANQAWLDERASWRSVIYLNLVRSVNDILDVLVQQMGAFKIS